MSSWPTTITQENIDEYARVSGDFNPLHVDPDFARTTPFGSTIAHGTISAALITRYLTQDLGWGDRLSRMTLKYVGPVRAGDSVVCGAELHRDAETAAVDGGVYDVWCRNQRGEPVTLGQAFMRRDLAV